MKSFPKFCERNDLVSILPSSGVCRDGSRKTCSQIMCSVAAVVDVEDQAILRKSLRLAFAQDDADQTMVMRCRAVFATPRIQVHDFNGAVLRDHGFNAVACAAATMDALQQMCIVRKGKRFKNKLTGPEDTVDESLFNRVKKVTFCGASDGAAVEIAGIHSLKTSGNLPNLRYQFKDKPHTTRTCVKGTLKHMQSGLELWTLLVSGKGSFCNRARFNRRFLQAWISEQKTDVQDMYPVLQTLSYAEPRFNSYAHPMRILVCKLPAAIRVLVQWSKDESPSHREDRARATGLVHVLSGRAG